MKGLKIRVPDVPAYRATPESCGANPTPIAFAEVYLALQNGTVEAQENPLTTIEAKKFFEVQKHIMLTGHIVDGLTTQIAPHVWNKLTDAEKKIFTDVTQEAAAAPPRRSRSARPNWLRSSRRKAGHHPGRSQELRRRRLEEQAAGVHGLYDARTTTRSRPPSKTATAQAAGAGPGAGTCAWAGLSEKRHESNPQTNARYRQWPQGDGRGRPVPRRRRGRRSVRHPNRSLGRAGCFSGRLR
jgi:hypothetical protein